MQDLLNNYLNGPNQLRDAIAGMTDEQLNATPVAGKWSTRQVICHLADFEPVYADRIKRVLAEEKPTLMGGDPDLFAEKLSYDQRDIETELDMMTAVRKHLVSILQGRPAADFQRVGLHSRDGELTIETLLQRITNHIPHHIKFIEEKKQALGL